MRASNSQQPSSTHYAELRTGFNLILPIMGEHRSSHSQTDVDLLSFVVNHNRENGHPSEDDHHHHLIFPTTEEEEEVEDDNSIANTSRSITPVQQQAPYSRKAWKQSNISVPTFAAFRSQVSGIPIAYRGQQHPRHFSYAAQPSPRLVDSSPRRPISIDTVVRSSRAE